jgi:hypothetical protein
MRVKPLLDLRMSLLILCVYPLDFESLE